MSKNLNENLYARFGLKLDKEKVDEGFRMFASDVMSDAFNPLAFPDAYQAKYITQLNETRYSVLKDCCKELFLDYREYEAGGKYGTDKFIRDSLAEDDSLEKYLFNIQVILNVFWKHEILHDELLKLAEEIQQYANDFPILGITVKIYKNKAPQIFPAASKRLNEEIMDTLGILDTEEFKAALDDFETGYKLFSNAKTDSQFKGVIQSMHAACDEVVKAVLKEKNKSFKHAQDKEDSKRLGLGADQRQIFRNLKNWMDSIKHGSKKNIDRDEIEMIISMSAAFIRFVAVKHRAKN